MHKRLEARQESWTAPRRWRPLVSGCFVVFAALLILLPRSASGQESLRYSLATEKAERAREAAADIPYNIKFGEARMRFRAGLGLEYNDNVGVTETDTVDDFIIRPDVTTDLFWPITDQNALHFSVSVGYQKYLDNDQNDSLYIRPGSLLSFDVYVENLRINVHDRFSFYQDPIQQGVVSGTNTVNSQYGTGENLIGLGLDLVVSAGYDYLVSFATSDAFSYLDRSAHYFYVRPTVLVAPELTAGLESSVGLNRYDQSTLNDSEQITIGPFVDWQMSRFMRLSARGGYQKYNFDSSTNASDTSSYYASINLEHDVNRYVRYVLGVGHTVSLGVNSDAVNLSFIRMTARWQVLRQTDISTDMYFERGEEAGALTLNPETYERLGFSIALGYNITDKLNAGLRYSFTIKESDQPLRGYTQNVVGLNLGYRF